MEFHFHSLLTRLAALSLCYLLITVEDAGSTFVPGRCNCPRTQMTVRQPMKDFNITFRSPTCDKDEIIVVLKKNNTNVCLNPAGRLGKHLIRCWTRVTRKGLDVKRCLRRKKLSRQPGQKRHRGQTRRHTKSLNP